MWASRLSAVAWQGTLLGQDAKWTIGRDAFTTNDSNLPSQPSEFGFDLVPGGTKDNIFAGRRKRVDLTPNSTPAPSTFGPSICRRGSSQSTAFPPAVSTPMAGMCRSPISPFRKPCKPSPNMMTRSQCEGERQQHTHLDPRRELLPESRRHIKLQLNYLISDLDSPPAKNKKLILRLQTIF